MSRRCYDLRATVDSDTKFLIERIAKKAGIKESDIVRAGVELWLIQHPEEAFEVELF